MKIVIYRKTALIGTHGGIEKVISAFANAFTARGHKVVIMTRDKRKGSLFFPTDKQVKLINLFSETQQNFGKLRLILYKFFRRRKNGKKLLQKFPYFDREKAISDIIAPAIKAQNPDIILSCGISDSIDFMHKQQINIPIIQMFHSLPEIYLKAKNPHTHNLITETLKHIQAAQVLIPSFTENLRPYYSGPVSVIGNFVEQTKKNITYTPKNKYAIIYMARLDQHKQQDLLIRAFALIAKRHPDWEVNLWGSAEKSKKSELTNLIAKLNLQNQVFIRGITAEAQKELLNSDICAFPSAFEGFSLALTEAMAVGLPCIGLKTASAVNELIEDGVNGYLSDNTPEDFADKLEKLISSAETRRRFGLSGKEKIQQFSPDLIWNQWQDLISQTIGKYHA